MKGAQNAALLISVVLLAALPVYLHDRPARAVDGKPIEIFSGSDDKARQLIGEIAPDYRPWITPLLEPASSEIASLLFALQAALGAGFIGYYIGVSVTREKYRGASEQTQERSPHAD